MIFKDCVPDEVLYNRNYNGWRNDSIDVNHDGIADMIIRYYVMNNIFGSPLNQGYYNAENLTFISLVQSVQFACMLDTAVGNAFDECGNGGIKPYHTFTKIFSQNDIILMNNDSLWSQGSIYATFNVSSSTQGNCGGGGLSESDSSFYVAGRYIITNDTSLFYIHLGFQDYRIYLRDYALERQDSTINLSPTNISASPNPFTNQINISTDKAVEYQVTDYTGRVLLSGKTERSINTEILPSGSYLLLLKNEELYSVKKMVKVKQSP